MVWGCLSTNTPARPTRPPRTAQPTERLQEAVELLGYDHHEVRRYLEESVHTPPVLRK